MELNEKQEKFCQCYVGECNGNGTEAAIRAGYSDSKESAAVQASRLLRNVNIISRTNELRMEALRESGYDKSKIKELIQRRLVGIVTTNVTDVIHISPGKDDPNRAQVLKDLAEQNGGQQILDFGDTLIVPTTALTEEASGAIKKIKVIQATKFADGGVELEMNDVIAAAKLLAEISGIKESDGAVNINLFDEIEAARGRSSAAHESA